MKRKWIIGAFAATMLLLSAPVYAAQPEDATQDNRMEGHGRHHGGMYGKNNDERRLAKLRYMAEYFGIKTEGKSAEQLRTELEAAKQKDKAKWEAFKTEHKAKMLEHLRQKAKENGIATEGKTAEQLREELHKLHRMHHKSDAQQEPQRDVKQG
ncbi:hypothetical protein SAMN05216378_5757 [Paenibacillus catalpae]|uniref:Protein refolding chaperone Spy/CpxP family n=1 Tax=Paenibacillus catalpae TaxID=1045775 RepID=A0A1I2HFJ9_9BACL|nr:hypothetical protein [Paenibacillus catalpae]SFF28163.1 hypothetical protein SAMN05216378_5757 [Paenibacillus catalpae]